MFMRIPASAAAIAMALVATSAAAHSHLMQASPAQGAVLKASPTSIRMTFSEGLVPRFSGVVLTDGNGKPVPTGPTTVRGAENNQLAVPLRATLKPGVYSVAWHAVSLDTHRSTGRYSFKVAR